MVGRGVGVGVGVEGQAGGRRIDRADGVAEVAGLGGEAEVAAHGGGWGGLAGVKRETGRGGGARVGLRSLCLLLFWVVVGRRGDSFDGCDEEIAGDEGLDDEGEHRY